MPAHNPRTSPYFLDFLPSTHPPTIGWIDDDELEEVHELLWHGYAPARFVRHEWDFGVGGGTANPPAQLWQSERQRTAAIEARLREARALARRLRQETEKAEAAELWARFPPGSLCFVCDRCHGRYTSRISEDQAELDYLRAFAGRIEPVEQRMVLCGGCFNVMSRTGGGNGRNAA